MGLGRTCGSPGPQDLGKPATKNSYQNHGQIQSGELHQRSRENKKRRGTAMDIEKRSRRMDCIHHPNKVSVTALSPEHVARAKVVRNNLHIMDLSKTRQTSTGSQESPMIISTSNARAPTTSYRISPRRLWTLQFYHTTRFRLRCERGPRGICAKKQGQPHSRLNSTAQKP